jgi:hypothetical protein
VVIAVYQLSALRHERNSRTNYEIHVRTSAGWETRTTRSEMVDAVGEANRLLRQSGTQAVRVVRDLYDPVTNSTSPNTVFRASAPSAEGARGFLGGRWASGRIAAAVAGGAPRRRQLTTSLAGLLVVVGLGTAISWLRS